MNVSGREPSAEVLDPSAETSAPPADADASRDRLLDRKLASGVAWLGVLRWTAQVLSWATTILVARLLDSDAYGIVAVAAIFTSVASYFTEHGVARVVMLRKIDQPRTLAQLHAVCIGLGVLFGLIFVAGAHTISRVFDDHRLAGVVTALAVTPLLSGLFGVPFALLQQRLDYARIARIDLLRSAAQSATVLGSAVLGAGYWSLPAGIVATHAVGAILILRAAWLPPQRPSWALVREPLAYMRHITAGFLLWHVYSSSDKAVAGRVLDIAALGLYSFAWNIASLPGEKITNVLQGVAAPFFGNLGGDPPALRRYLLLMTESLALIIAPILVGFALVAPILVPMVFGQQWRDAVLPLQILVLYALTQNLHVLLNLVLSAAGRADVVTWSNAGLAVLLPVLFWFGASRSGVVGIAAVWALVQPIVLAVPLIVSRRLFAMPIRMYAGALAAPVVGCMAMVAVVLLVERLAGPLADAARGAAMIATGAVVYPVAVLLLFRGRLTALGEVWFAGRRAS